MAGTLRRPVLLELVETLRRLPRLEALHHLLRMATHLRRHHVETVKQFLTHASVCLLRGATHQSVGHGFDAVLMRKAFPGRPNDRTPGDCGDWRQTGRPRGRHDHARVVVEARH